MDNDNWFFIAVGILLLIVFILVGVSYHLEKQACEKFGGKITSNLKCYKVGNLYEIVEVEPLTFKYKVAKPTFNLDS